MNKRQLFLAHVGQTSPIPVSLDISHASGVYIFDQSGKKYMDLNSGIAVSSLGHCHPKVVSAVQHQVSRYMHTMVYGEHIQTPQVEFASLLVQNMHKSLSSIYFLMAGTEATETAMKLAKRVTGRSKIIACKDSYHGSTQGAESLRSDENYKQAFYPLIPGIIHIEYNNIHDINKINTDVAAIILEPVQGEAGVRIADQEFLKLVRQRCSATGTLMVLDEIQSGFGRTGSLFCYQKKGVIPDVMLIGKAMGGGMPIAGVVASTELMRAFTKNPMLGHITTFGGHPVSSAAGLAALKVLLEKNHISTVESKAIRFYDNLIKHPIVKEIRYEGLLMAVELKRRKYLKHVVHFCLENGAIIDYFLFNKKSFRLAPPLIISDQEIDKACKIINNAFAYAENKYLQD